MPAPDTGGTETPPGARAIVEALGLDAGALADGDLSALTYQHSSDQFNPSEFEALAHFPPELDCLNSTVEVESSLGDALDSGGEVLSVEETVESVEIVTSVHDPNDVPHSPGSILPDIVEEGSNDDMDINDMGISDSPETDPLHLSSSHHLASLGNSLAFASSPMNAKTPQAGSSIVVIQSPVASSTCLTPTSFSQTHVTVSGGQIVGKISGSVPIGTMPQFQPITQTLVTAKSSDGNIVQLRPTNVNRQAAMTTSTNFTSSALQGIKPLQATVKRPAAATSGQIRNVFAKVIITGNQQNQQGQPVMLTTSQAEGLTSGQPLKIVTSTGQSSAPTLLASPTKAITLAQAQQMGLIQPTRIHSVTPSSPSKNIVVNKFVTSPVKMPAKLVMPASTVVKIPTKILPAPTSMQQSLGGVATVSGATAAVSTVNTTVKPLSPQKVIIRQGSLKPGTVLTSTAGPGQVISIPATQNVMGPAVSIGQVQMQGTRQLQYVRLVSTASGSTSTVASTARTSTDVLPATAVSATARPLVMSTIRSQPQAVKMVPIAPATPSVRTVVPKPATGQPAQRILIPAATPVSQFRGAQNVATLQASTVTGAAILPSGGNSYVMLPAHYVEQVKNLQAQQQLNQQKHQEHQMQQDEQQEQQLQQHSQPLQQAQQLQQQSRQHQQAQLQPQKEKTQTQQQDSNSVNSLSSGGGHTQTSSSANADNSASSTRSGASSRTTLEPNGIRPRKPCNCTKSQCLKLYCDCFANGEFCHMCNCNNCYNNLDHEEDRQRAIKSCLERNPNAFRPKIGKGMVGDERRHNKGCNCKRSGCLKNYCECYEAKIPCSNNCRCIGCRNVEESCDKKSLRDLADAAEVRVQQQTAIKNKLSAHIQDIARPQASAQSGSRHAFNFMTQDVIHATCQCMLAQAEDSERSNNSETQAERLILEEFGRCLVQIIDCASKTEASAVQM